MWQRVSFVKKNNRKTEHDFVIYSPLKTCPPCKVQGIQGVHKVLHTFKILISQKPHMVETLDFRQ